MHATMKIPRQALSGWHLPPSAARVSRACFSSSPACLRQRVGEASGVPIENIRREMQARPAKTIYDMLSPTPSHLLNISLSDYLPAECWPRSFLSRSTGTGTTGEVKIDTRLPSAAAATAPPLPQGHHLVYFPPQIPPSSLLPDGTDPDHSPGGAFVRRMWAGGSVRFAEGWREAMRLDGRRAVCVESVGDVELRGPPGAEKIFVDVWRRYGPVGVTGAGDGADAEAEVDLAAVTRVREQPAIEERRSLVFMREKTSEQAREDVQKAASRIVKAPFTPDYSASLTPPASLLFHFSALTFNAHAIHLDRQYCREVEGHRNLLFHGPLSLTLMLSAIRSQLRGGGDGAGEPAVRSIEYRNVAPLYAEEQLTVSLRKSPNGNGNGAGADGAGGRQIGEKRWDVWVEGPAGGLAVKGSVVTA